MDRQEGLLRKRYIPLWIAIVTALGSIGSALVQKLL
jgi:hypothetical protein